MSIAPKNVKLFLKLFFSPEFLQSRVEVPMLGIVTGGAMAFMALLILSLIVLCLMQKNKSKSIGETIVCLCVSQLENV